MATITCLARTRSFLVSTITLLGRCVIRRTGAFSRTRFLPIAFATRRAISCEPPKKRHICAPSRVLKLRSKVPGFCSLPDAAM